MILLPRVVGLEITVVIYKLKGVLPSISSSESPGENVNLLCVIMLTFVVLTIHSPSEQPPVNATACVPFRHDGEIVSGCVGKEGVEETIEMEGEGGVINRETVSGRWCASAVDENLNAVSVIACPTMPPVTEQPLLVTPGPHLGPIEYEAPTEQPPMNATACVPFRHDGEIVSGCVGEEGVEETIEMEGEGGVINRETVSGRWCASEVDENLNAVSVIACPTILPVTEEPPPETTPINPFESRSVPKKPEYEAETEPPPPESLCVPFRYGDEIVSGCVGEQGKEEIIKTEGEGGVITWWTVKGRWCASEVDENLNPVTIILCDVCVPFSLKGMLMRGCVGGQWCAAEVDEDMNVMKAMSCPEISFVTEPLLETTSTFEYEVSAETEEPPSESSGCVPFRYGEEIVSGCVGEEGVEETIELEGEGGVINRETVSGRWCASAVDENLNAVSVIACPTVPSVIEQPPSVTSSESPAPSEQPLVYATECVPFRHNGEIVSGCVGEEGVEETIEMEGEGGVINRETVSGRWCASAVDENLNAVSIIACPTVPPVIELPPSVTSSESPAPSEQPPVNATECVPFRHDGEIVSGCVGEEGVEETIEMEGEGGVINRETVSGRWCASAVDENMNAKKIISCPEMSPVIEQPPQVTSIEPQEYVVTVDNKLCVFPFTWSGVVYSNCTTAGRRIPWCATQVNERREPVSSGYCRDTLVGPVPPDPPPFVPDERAVNTSKCKFPFIYKGMTYFNCTREDSLIPWCALDVDRNRRPTRIGCCHGQDGVSFHPLLPEGPGGISPTQLTVSGEKCIFPFQHDGEWRYSCVPSEEWGSEQGQGKGRSWCVTRIDAFAQPIVADYCAEPTTQAPVSLNKAYPERWTTDGHLCVFPFWHQGRWYKDCARNDSEEDPARNDSEEDPARNDFKEDSDEDPARNDSEEDSDEYPLRNDSDEEPPWNDSEENPARNDSKEDPWCATEVRADGAVLKAGKCRQGNTIIEQKCKIQDKTAGPLSMKGLKHF
ncbi:uncharacterized protein [Penaeus vannamei]|uniref:uncharacterized protein n=1 Tax=Penaeus vannamei TaxID=6689 RepID=UPI00387FAF75